VKESITKAVCVDFDGVIAALAPSLDEFGPTIPGAVEALRELRALGLKIIIYTARPNVAEHLDRLTAHLCKEGIEFDEINGNSDCEWPATKPLADLYIDDRACRFEGNWSKTLADAKRFLGLTVSHTTPSDYSDLLALVTQRRDQVERFEALLRAETNWATAPASTRFHLAKEGGLVEHSTNVARTLLKLRGSLAPELAEESCVIVGLYHDIGKVGGFGKPYYLPNPSDWHVRNRGIRYVVNKDLVHLDIATRSLFLASQHITLSDEEAQAIRYHDGQYIPENQSVAHRETILTRLLQYADNWSGGVIEGENQHGKIGKSGQSPISEWK